MKKKGQVWIETVLYTLIGLTLMGLALGFVMPKINEARDRALVEQAISSLSEVDGKISETIQRGSGNVRTIEVTLKRGELYVDGVNDQVRLSISGLSAPYSQPGVEISSGNIKINSTKSSVLLIVSYSANLTYGNQDIERKFTAASTPYKFTIENKGLTGDPAKTWVNIEEISNR